MQLKDVVTHLDAFAPLRLAEPWDNVGLLTGDPDGHIADVMLCIDATAEVLAEAAGSPTDLLVAYHPPLFKPVKRLAWDSPVAVAARRNLAIYSPHTALDAVQGGTNDVLADAAGLGYRTPLQPAATTPEHKLVTFVPVHAATQVADALFAAGAGRIGTYTHCSHSTEGEGTFLPGPGSMPATGTLGELSHVAERRLEVRLPAERLMAVVAALQRSHPYEEPAYDVLAIVPVSSQVGQGRVGTLPAAEVCSLDAFRQRLSRAMGVPQVALASTAAAERKPVQRVAVAAGAGDALWPAAHAAGVDVFVTGELRHHTVLAALAAGTRVVALGHDGSERAALAPLMHRLRARVPNLRVRLSQADVSPWRRTA
jgi:dinuclear metal center YbgI/SA1388 family protein